MALYQGAALAAPEDAKSGRVLTPAERSLLRSYSLFDSPNPA